MVCRVAEQERAGRQVPKDAGSTPVPATGFWVYVYIANRLVFPRRALFNGNAYCEV